MIGAYHGVKMLFDKQRLIAPQFLVAEGCSLSRFMGHLSENSIDRFIWNHYSIYSGFVELRALPLGEGINYVLLSAFA